MVERLDNIKVLCALIDERIEVFQREKRREKLLLEHRGTFRLGDEAEAEVGVELAPANPPGWAASRSGGDESMDYKKALEIGHKRAEEAAEAIHRWTGVEALAVCAVKPDSTDERWRPVGKRSFKEIARDDGLRGDGRYHLLIVDENGTTKACTRKRYPLGEALRMADRLPIRVAMPGTGELWNELEKEERILCSSADSS